jgi:hypothetical protein
VNRRVLLFDLAIAAALAIVVIVVSPGLAVVAIFALVMIAGLLLAWVTDHVRRGRK